MWLCHCSVIWDPVAAVTPVPRALRGCGQFCHILVLLTAPKLGAGSCQVAEMQDLHVKQEEQFFVTST